MLAVLGPALALWGYGPYPENLAMPLVLGGAGGLFGFVAGVIVFGHPLQAELGELWLKMHRRPA